jgi:hypothetical protein
MTHVLKALPFLAALIGAPAWAAEPDPHAGHHPAAVAETPKPAAPTVKSDAEPAMPKCPMMDGKPTGGSDATPGKAPDGKMKMDGKDMHCMPAPAKGAEAPHDHDHPEAAPK